HAFPGVGFCLGEGQEIDWIGHTEYSETRIEQLDHIFNLIGIIARSALRDEKGGITPEQGIAPSQRRTQGAAVDT
ncbi:hypothetical protein, partial [Aeromonas caviae]|uniref:hypothetical protein n=2 Tax=Aeromonas TaxID=642 RepID=UPI0013265E91